MLDLVYINGGKKIWGDSEIRFSLRSAEKYLQFNRVIIVGDKPKYLNDKVIHFYYPDNKKNKYWNVAYKIKEMLKIDDISEDIIFMNDDFFLLKSYPVIPYYYNKTIKEWVEEYPFDKGEYYSNIEKLYADFPEGKFFEVHFPIVYNRKMALRVIEKYKLELTLMLRSYYCNEYIDRIKPIKETKDYKVYFQNDILNYFKNAPFVSSTNEMSANSYFKSSLMSRFPKKSKYEI